MTNYSSEILRHINRDCQIQAFVSSGMSVNEAFTELHRIEYKLASESWFLVVIEWFFDVIGWFLRGLLRVIEWVTGWFAALWHAAKRLIIQIAADRQNRVMARRHVSSHIMRHGIQVTTAAARLLDMATWLIPLAHRARWSEEFARELIEITRTHPRKVRHLTYAMRVLATMPSFRRALKAGPPHVDTPAQR